MGRADGKVAIVTGGASGIGRATCELLAREGAQVAVTDFQEGEGQAVAGETTKRGGVAGFWLMDVTRESSVQDVLVETHRHFGRSDALVNNAGIARADKPTHDVTEQEWDEVMDVNVKGVFLCTNHVIPYMKQGGGGGIVSTSSMYGIVGYTNLPPHRASKGAVRLMTKTDWPYYPEDPIRVNSV